MPLNEEKKGLEFDKPQSTNRGLLLDSPKSIKFTLPDRQPQQEDAQNNSKSQASQGKESVEIN